MHLAHAAHVVCDLKLARFRRRLEPCDYVRVPAFFKKDQRHIDGQRPVRGHRAAELRGLPAAVVYRQRRLEHVARSDEAGGVGHGDELRRDLALHRRRAGRRCAVRHRRDAQLAHELRQLHDGMGPTLDHGHASGPQRERLEPPRRDRAHPAQHLRAGAAAGLHAADARLPLAQHRQDAAVEVVERMLRVAGLREPSDRVGRWLARQDVYRLVHHGDQGDRRVRRAHLHVDRAEVCDLRLEGDRHFVLGGAYEHRRLPVRPCREVPRIRAHALHDGDEHVDVRRKLGAHGPQHHFACGVGQLEHLGVDLLVAQNRKEREPRERGLHRKARRLADAVDQLVRRDRHRGRVGKRRPHGVVAPVAKVEAPRIRHVGGGVAYREHIVAGPVRRNHKHAVKVRLRRQHDVRGDEDAHAVAVPGLAAVAALAVGIHGVYALELRREPAGLAEAATVGRHASHPDAKRGAALELHPLRQRAAYVVRVEVRHHALARSRWAPAVLEHHALRYCTNGSLRKPRRRPERRGEAYAPVPVEPVLAGIAEVRLQPEAVVSEVPPLPLRRGERNVLEHHRALADQSVRRAAEEVLRRDREAEVRRIRRVARLHTHSYLGRGEFLDLDFARADLAALLPRELRANGPRAAGLFVRHTELVAEHCALVVRHLGDCGADNAIRIQQLQPYRRRTWRASRPVPHERVQHYSLAVAVDAAVGPAERAQVVLGEVLVAGAVGIRLVHRHRAAKRHERHVVVGAHDHGEGLALVLPFRTAPSERVRRAGHHQDAGGRVHLHAGAAHGRALHQRHDPHAEAVAVAPANAEAKVGKAHEAAPQRIQLDPLVAIPHIVAARTVSTQDAHQEHAVRRLAVVHADRQQRRLLLVQAVRALYRRFLGLARQLGGLLVVGIAAPRIAAVDFFLAGQHLHDVARLDAADRRLDARHVDRFEAYRPGAAGGQVAPGRGEVHVGVAVLAPERVRVVRDERFLAVGRRPRRRLVGRFR